MTLSTKAKWVLIVLVVLVLAGIYITVNFLMSPPPPPVSVPPSVQLLESRLVGRKDGTRQWEILSNSVLQSGDLVTLSDMDEMIMFQQGEAHLFVQAQGATWERSKDLLELKGPVVVEDDDDFRLESDFLIWDGIEETLVSPGPVLILWDGLEIEASEMVLETEANLLYLKKDVRIRDGSLVWMLQEAMYDLDQEFMDFYGDIVLEEEVRESD